MTGSTQATLLQNSLEGEAGPGGVGYATDAEPMEAMTDGGNCGKFWQDVSRNLWH
jgi:hypothetical protein